jgi:cyclopropane-fatty-acyl-phospholipid synthase
MRSNPRAREAALRSVAARLAEASANLTLVAPGLDPLRIGARPDAARVVFKTEDALDPLVERDHLALAEAHLEGRIDIEGDLLEALTVVGEILPVPSRLDRLRLWLRLVTRRRARYERESVAFHYDRPPAFFLPWLDRWRCYSHGIYGSPEDEIAGAMARKMQRAIDALRLEPGMDVFDMGGGWGCFVEYAGLQGIRVHSITISEEQHRFVQRLIREKELPCTSELVNLRVYTPRVRFDGAVFMGTFEHYTDYRSAARFLARHLEPGGRLWADFCAQRSNFTLGRFMKRYLWPGPVTYVNPYRWVREFVREGFNIYEMEDDTLSYAYTVRDWHRALVASRKALAEQFGEPAVRAFLLFLGGSYHFLMQNRTQAYHVVAGLGPRPVTRGER